MEDLRARTQFAMFWFDSSGDRASVSLDFSAAIMNRSSLLMHGGDLVKTGPGAFLTPTVGAFLNFVP